MKPLTDYWLLAPSTHWVLHTVCLSICCPHFPEYRGYVVQSTTTRDGYRRIDLRSVPIQVSARERSYMEVNRDGRTTVEENENEKKRKQKENRETLLRLEISPVASE